MRQFSWTFYLGYHCRLLHLSAALLLCFVFQHASAFADDQIQWRPVVQVPSVQTAPETLMPIYSSPHVSFTNTKASMGKGFIEGVTAYRQGQFVRAEQILKPLHEQAPDQTRITYYLGLTRLQLSDFTSAKALFDEVVLLDPHGEAAPLAQKALAQLKNLGASSTAFNQNQTSFQLDSPPDINAITHTQPSNTDISPQFAPSQSAFQQQMENAQTGSGPIEAGQGSSGMSPQELMQLQMMLGGGGNNNQNNMMGGMNPMMLQGMMGQQNPNSPNGQNSTLDPSFMSTMLMNQMLQNFNLESKNNNNND